MRPDRITSPLINLQVCYLSAVPYGIDFSAWYAMKEANLIKSRGHHVHRQLLSLFPLVMLSRSALLNANRCQNASASI